MRRREIYDYVTRMIGKVSMRVATIVLTHAAALALSFVGAGIALAQGASEHHYGEWCGTAEFYHFHCTIRRDGTHRCSYSDLETQTVHSIEEGTWRVQGDLEIFVETGRDFSGGETRFYGPHVERYRTIYLDAETHIYTFIATGETFTATRDCRLVEGLS